MKGHDKMHSARGFRTHHELLRVAAMCSLPLLIGTGCTPAQTLRVNELYDSMMLYSSKGDPLTIAGYDVPTARQSGRFSAGAAAIDITPPPGFPTGGDGPVAEVARGYWLRLKARAFFFEDAEGHTLALVTADLFAAPASLRHAIAAEVSKQNTGLSFPPESLIVAANHTHQGPGNFLSARVHNQFGSSFPGYQDSLFRFLVARIARCITLAIADARRSSGDVEISAHVRKLSYDFLLNRSPKTFMLNRNRDELLAELNRGETLPDCAPHRGEPDESWLLPGCPRLRAADRNLTVIDVIRKHAQQRHRVGAMVFFAAHPTVLSPETPFYSPDFTGYAMNIAETQLSASSGSAVVVGFFNGAEGDVTLRRTHRDLLEVHRFGTEFAREVLLAADSHSEKQTNPNIEVRARDWSPLAQGKCNEARLAAKPMVGAAMLGGAEGDRSQLHQLGWRDGVRDTAVDDQGVKLPALDTRILRGLRITDLMITPDAFPDSIPLTYASLGKIHFAAVPAELTTAQGLEIRHALDNRPHGELEIIGLANEYLSYCSSADEYWAQDYMGASTIWGSNQGPYMACRLRELAYSQAAKPRSHVTPHRYSPGLPPRRLFGPTFLLSQNRPDEGLDLVLLGRGHGQEGDGLDGLREKLDRVPERSLPWLAWSEPPSGSCWEQNDHRRVSVDVLVNGTWMPFQTTEIAQTTGALHYEDDAHAGFLTTYLGGSQWAAIWLRPLFDPELSGAYAFRVQVNGTVHRSKAFCIAAGQRGPDRVEELVDSQVSANPCPTMEAARGNP